jgi:hypothetical protein
MVTYSAVMIPSMYGNLLGHLGIGARDQPVVNSSPSVSPDRILRCGSFGRIRTGEKSVKRAEAFHHFMAGDLGTEYKYFGLHHKRPMPECNWFFQSPRSPLGTLSPSREANTHGWK